jgi:hypothetical protein
MKAAAEIQFLEDDRGRWFIRFVYRGQTADEWGPYVDRFNAQALAPEAGNRMREIFAAKDPDDMAFECE